MQMLSVFVTFLLAALVTAGQVDVSPCGPPPTCAGFYPNHVCKLFQGAMVWLTGENGTPIDCNSCPADFTMQKVNRAMAKRILTIERTVVEEGRKSLMEAFVKIIGGKGKCRSIGIDVHIKIHFLKFGYLIRRIWIRLVVKHIEVAVAHIMNEENQKVKEIRTEVDISIREKWFHWEIDVVQYYFKGYWISFWFTFRRNVLRATFRSIEMEVCSPLIEG